MKSILTRVVILVSAAAVAAAAWTAIGGSLHSNPAFAIAPHQYACGTPFLSITASRGYVAIPGAKVTVSGEPDPQGVVVMLSVDAGVQLNAEMRSTFTVDGAAPHDYTYGPGNIAENQQYWGTRTTMNVIPSLAPGLHTIQAWVRISGAPTLGGVVSRYCMTAEKNGS